MSGSNSSARGATEPLGLTVHSLPAPEVQDPRTRSGRIKMLLLLLVCSAPVIAAYFMYFVVHPSARSNYGALIQPTRALPELGLKTLQGVPVAPASLKGQWLLVVVGPAACGPACEKRLFLQRQLREMLGHERDRVDKLWLVTDGAQPAEPLRQALAATPAMQVLQADAAAVAAWLAPEPGHALEDHLYLVDPMGEWMMRTPADPDPRKVKGDLDRLLRASAAWDKPGR